MIKKLKIAIDSPAAAGAGTQAKLISKHYNLLYLDTGKIYRLIAKIKLKNPKKFNYKYITKIMKNLNLKKLEDNKLISNQIGDLASVVSKDKKIRTIVHNFQINCAYNPPKKYKGSCLDGRDITYKIIPDADLKLDNKINYANVLKSIIKRDKSDYNRKISPLKKTKDSILINTSNLSKRACFLKIKKYIDKKIKN